MTAALWRNEVQGRDQAVAKANMPRSLAQSMHQRKRNHFKVKRRKNRWRERVRVKDGVDLKGKNTSHDLDRGLGRI